MELKRKSCTDDYNLMTYVGTPSYSAVRGLLAYTRTKADSTGEVYISQVIIKDIESGAERVITAGGNCEESPMFSTDGGMILFASNASGAKQIYTCTWDGKDIACQTNMPHGVEVPTWSPDGKAIAFLSPKKDEVSSDDKNKQPIVIIDFGYKSDEDKGFTQPETSHLWVKFLDEDEARCLSDGDRDHVMPVWSPDSSTIIVTSNRNQPREESIAMDLFSVPAMGGKLTQLTKGMWIAYYPASFTPVFTPDGEYIILGALAPSLEGGMPLTHLFRLPAAGGDAVCIFPEKAPCHEATCFLYNGINFGGRRGSAQVSSDGQYLYFISGWHGACNIYKAAIFGEPEIAQVTFGAHSYRSIDPPQGGNMLVLKGDFFHTPQAYLFNENTGSEIMLTNSNSWMDEAALSQSEEMWMDTIDGAGKVQGWVIPPQNMECGEKYPTVLYIHGGPTPFYGAALTYEFQCLAGAGIGVVICNPRGSSGYGSAYQDMKKAFDGTAMYDLLQFVDEAVRRYNWIDSKRIGVTGGSYGGYMTNWIAGHTKRFKAAVTQRSIANYLIQDASSDMVGSSKSFESMTDYMVDAVKRSPIAYADKIDIPFLILHSIGDMRCPVEHAHQLFTAVKDTHPDLPVRMVLFPYSNHGLPMDGPMHLRVSHYNETINWFKKYL